MTTSRYLAFVWRSTSINAVTVWIQRREVFLASVGPCKSQYRPQCRRYDRTPIHRPSLFQGHALGCDARHRPRTPIPATGEEQGSPGQGTLARPIRANGIPHSVLQGESRDRQHRQRRLPGWRTPRDTARSSQRTKVIKDLVPVTGHVLHISMNGQIEALALEDLV